MLPQSYKTMNQNFLKTKIKPFREKYSQSLSRTNHKTSMQTLASSVYSIKKNSSSTLQKSRSKIDINPEQYHITNALKGLDLRASQISNLSEHNTQLLLQKKDLQDKILNLKEEIAKETRLKNRAQTNWKIHQNHNSYSNQSLQQLLKKSQKINDNISQTKQQNNQLTKQINQLKHNNNDKQNNIAIQLQNVQNKSNQVNILKSNLLSEERKRNYLKDQLIKDQRFMDSLSIQTKELENQKAMVLLDINSSVVRNKL